MSKWKPAERLPFPCPVCGLIFPATPKTRQGKFPSCGSEACQGAQDRARSAAWHVEHPTPSKKVAKPAPEEVPVKIKLPREKRCICRHPSSHSYVCAMARKGKSVTRDPRIVALAERALAA
jgi:hypothetical protein